MPFNIGTPEILIILLIALLILGPSKLPQIARHLGEAIKEFRRAVSEFSSSSPSSTSRLQSSSPIPAEAHKASTSGTIYDRELLVKIAEKLGIQTSEAKSDEDLMKEIIEKAKQQGLIER